ncbi:MAG TPA: ComEC/Rec2 family competence protein [Candidatus Baltobacteraceae bacterium]|nr:ComEC/Rec2 family competence protein [Candidatus Baltobacteraceae bacterium]
MQTRPLLVFGLGTAAGAALAQPIEAGVRHILVVALLCAAGYALIAMRSRMRTLLAVCAVAAGMASAKIHEAHTPAAPLEHTVRLVCTVLERAQETATGSSFTCATDKDGVYAVFSSGHAPVPGRSVLLRGRLEPFDGPRNPGEADQRAIEAEKGLAARIASAHILAVVPAPCMGLQCLLARAHAWAGTQLQHRMSEPYASIAAGELWGARGSLFPELRIEFQETGTVHILVTAGLHLGVIAFVVMALLRLLTLQRAWACMAAIAVIWAYAIFSGAHLPSVRAALMISYGLAAYAVGAAPLSWSAYGFAMGIVALAWPQTVTGASFALSFSCVGAITLLGDELTHILEPVMLQETFKEALILTVATQVGTWPLTASIFLIIAPYAVFANLMVVPVVGFTMILGALQLSFEWMSPIAQLFANADSWMLAWIVGSVHFMASMPHARIVPHPPPDAIRIAFYDAAIIGAVYFWRNGTPVRALVAVLFGLIAVLAPPVHDRSQLRITVLDVGQADGIVIQTPLGHTIIVDAGGRLERSSHGQSSAEIAGERVLLPFLIRSGVSRVDAVILTHPHGDHSGGVAPVLRMFRTTQFADGGQTYGGQAYNDALQTARTLGVPVFHPRAGTVWKTDDGLILTFIGPSLPFIESDNTVNDNSIAFILQYKHFRMLFTGDAGVAGNSAFYRKGSICKLTF